MSRPKRIDVLMDALALFKMRERKVTQYDREVNTAISADLADDEYWDLIVDAAVTGLSVSDPVDKDAQFNRVIQLAQRGHDIDVSDRSKEELQQHLVKDREKIRGLIDRLKALVAEEQDKGGVR